jgi:hypothetical protein
MSAPPHRKPVRRDVPNASLRTARRTATILGVAPCQLFPKATVSRRKPPRRFGESQTQRPTQNRRKVETVSWQHLREMTIRSA